MLADEVKTRIDKIDGIESSLAETTSYIDKSKENSSLSNIQKMIVDSVKRPSQKVTYVIVGDSTRASYGAWIYTILKEKLSEYNVDVKLVAQSGLKAEHWSETTVGMQPGYPTVSNVFPLLSGDGSTCIVDICLGINDIQTRTAEQVKTYIKNGIDKIKTNFANTNIILTSPNQRADLTTFVPTKKVFDDLISANGYAYVNVLENVWKSWDEANSGYFLDTTHPNELGQRKMASYILSKILPSQTANKLPFKMPLFRDMVEIIIPSGQIVKVYAQVKVLKGNDNLFLKKITSTGWYIIQSGESNSSSTVITNTGFNYLDKGYSANSEVVANVYVSDLDKLNELPINSKVSIKKCVVSEFEYITDYDQIFTGTNNQFVQKLKGTIDQTDPNYNTYKDSGLKIEFRYISGTAISNLYFGRLGSNFYLFGVDAGGNAISETISFNEKGYIKLLKPSYGTTEFESMLYIADMSKLTSMPDGTRLKLSNWNVSAITPRQTIQDYLMSI